MIVFVSLMLLASCTDDGTENVIYRLNIIVADSDSTAITYNRDDIISRGNQMQITNENRFDIEVIATLQDTEDLSGDYDLSQTIKAGDTYLWETAKSGGTYNIGCRADAKEGSEVNITDNGTLTVNGVLPSEEVYYPTLPAEDSEVKYPYTVEKGKVFILNDFRTDVSDSRTFGAVDAGEIQGPLLLTMRRRGF